MWYDPLPVKENRILATAVYRAISTTQEARKTPEMLEAIRQSEILAEEILAAMENSTSIEQLIEHEMSLQQLDTLLAQTDQDRSSIKNAQRDYQQLLRTVKQMRRNTLEYFEANLSLKEAGGDIGKIPGSRGLKQLAANKARLQNRAAFASEEQRSVWEARAILAGKTAERLNTLHTNLVKKLEKPVG